MKINQVLMESAGATVAFAFGRFNPAHQGHIEVWRAVEDAGANWFIGTNPNTIGPNDPLTFEQKSAWMTEIYPPISGHIVAQTSVLTLAAYIFKKTRKNERATVAYVTDATDWAWSGKLLNQYNGVEGSHGYYKFAEITHVPSPRVSSATALRDAARANDKVAFYQASGTDPKSKVAGLTYFDTVKQAVEKYPLPVKRVKKVKEQGVAEDLNEAVSDNYLYHATMPAGMMRILRTGIIKATEFIIESNNIASAEQVWDYVDGSHPKDQQGGGFLKSLVMRNPQYELKRVPLSSLHVPNDKDEGNDPYGRAMFVDVDHAREYSQHHIDKKPLVVDSRGHILDGAHRAWAASELLNKTDIMAWVPVKQSVAEGSDSNLSYQGNCTEDDVIEHIFGDVNNFANMVEEHGDEFTVGDLVVKYDPETDVHSFYYKKQGVAENQGDSLKFDALEKLIAIKQQIQQEIQQKQEADIAAWKQDFEKNTVQKAKQQLSTTLQTTPVAQAGEKYNALKDRLVQLNVAIQKHKELNNLIDKIKKEYPVVADRVDSYYESILPYAKAGAKDNYKSLIAKLNSINMELRTSYPRAVKDKQSVTEADSPTVAHTAKNLENPPKIMQHRAKRDVRRDQQWWDTQIAGRDTDYDEWDEPKETNKLKRSVKENASRMISAHDKNGFITVIIQAPDGSKKAITNDNPRYINQWLMRYDLQLPPSITNKFKQFSLNEFAPSDDSHGDEKSYLLQLADDLFQAIYIAKNKMAVQAVKEKIAAAGGNVKIVWNNNGSFNVVMYHPVHFKQGHLVSLVGDSDSQRMGEGTDYPYNKHRRSTANSRSSPELRHVPVPGDMSHPEWKEPLWSFQEISDKLGIGTDTLKAYMWHYPGFPEKKQGIKSTYGSKTYYSQRDVKRWVNANDIRNIIKSKQGVKESTNVQGPVEAWGYRYNERDQRVMWRLNFDSEQAAHKWADSKNATVVEVRPVKQLAEEEHKTVAKTWDQMTPEEKSSGVKGRTLWNEKTQRYYTVFDVPVKDKEVDEAASLKTMRDFFAGDKNARDPFEITKQRMHFSNDTELSPTHRKDFRSQEEYEKWLEQNKLKKVTSPVYPKNDKISQIQGPQNRN